MEEENLRQSDSRKFSAILRRKLLEKHNYSCSICGVKNEDIPLEIAHLIPLYQGGETSEKNRLFRIPYANVLYEHLRITQKARSLVNPLNAFFPAY